MKLCKHHSLVDDAWFCDLITVQGPGACEEAAFPCYRWVQGQGVLSLPEGTGEGLGGGRAGMQVKWPSELGTVGGGHRRWRQDRGQGNVPQFGSYSQDEGQPGRLEGKVAIWRRPLPRRGRAWGRSSNGKQESRVERRSACGQTNGVGGGWLEWRQVQKETGTPGQVAAKARR